MLRKFLKIQLKFLRIVPSNQKRDSNSKNQSQKQLQETSNSLRLKYRLYRGKLPNRLQVVLQPVSSLLPAVIPWTVIFAAYGFLVSLLVICNTILSNVQEIISFTPQSARASSTLNLYKNPL